MLTEKDDILIIEMAEIAQARAYLASTDFYMTVDKHATLTVERRDVLIQLRADARAVINNLETI